MRIIYHLIPRAAWQQLPPGPYAPPSLAAEGFIHCSTADQVERVANRFLADEPALLVLHLDADQLGPLVRDEPPAGVPVGDSFAGELFPHVYGPIDRAVILAAEYLQRSPDGRWQFQRRDAMA